MTQRMCFGLVLAVVGLVAFGRSCEAQGATGASEQVALAKTVSGSAGSGAALPASPAAPAGAQTVGAEPKRTALALETDKLVAMAAELKARVDKTNKDILSLEVVQEAQAIEQFAHQMKQEAGKK
jgi:hypothetical protein